MRSRYLSLAILLLLWFSMTPAATHATTTFRITDLDLMDAHVYVSIPFFGCSDVTNSVPLGLSPSFNEQIQALIQTDDDMDGYLDVSYVIVFTPLDQMGAGGTLEFGKGTCVAPLIATACEPDGVTPPTAYVYTNMTGGTCLAPFSGTTYGPYTPDITNPTAPCFVADVGNLDLDLGNFILPLTDVHIAATYVGAPATSLASGLLRGFLSEEDAANIIVDFGSGPTPFSTALPGGSGNCSTNHSDKDTVNGVVGWWFYFNFTANEVPYTEPPTAVRETPGSSLELDAAYPNPFNPSTSLRYSLEDAGFVRLSIYDTNGRFVADVVRGEQPAGEHVAAWDGRGANGAVVSSGIYFVRIESGGQVRTRKIALLK